MVRVGDTVYIHGREIDIPCGDSPLPAELTGLYLQVAEVITGNGFIHCFDSIGLPVKLYKQEYDIVKDKRFKRNLPKWW